ncbi:unnamed protein product [Candidula unifasciata]|uniref:tRNA (guanine(37)-N1)-methyltransferase n=1 Tax=Candidula unifasciata TaxID=100452 RepID=A0A8S3Z1G5_9EUPU|nr:unnamed protein product [Candidula unifasciata]
MTSYAHWTLQITFFFKKKRGGGGSPHFYRRFEPGLLHCSTMQISALLNVLRSLQRVKMDIKQGPVSSKLAPPESVKGMVQLNRDAFTKVVKVPAVRIAKCDIGKTQKALKPLFLKLAKLKPVVEMNDSSSEKSQCLILLDPDKLRDDNLSQDKKLQLQNLGLDIDNPEMFEVELSYNNWTLSDIMRAILPSDQDSVSTFTQIGHIAHLNLKEETLPYKHLIGEIIIDKIPSVKTVVNKIGAIDNTFRVFQMDLLAGEENYITQIREHGCAFELDFSKVYWNSRLGTEHAKLTDLIEKGSVVYDVFAGIGPFAVPLAKKKLCTVFANDLNPSSFEYLKKNMDLNKLANRTIKAYNLDGREFIKSVVKSHIIDRIRSAVAEANKALSPEANGVSSELEESDIPVQASIETTRTTAEKQAIPHSYIIMNLPALAVEFLDSFTSLLQDMPADLKVPDMLEPFLPHVFCYTFSPKNYLTEDFQSRVEMILGQPLPDPLGVRLVRNVAPNKEMVCLSFKLWPNLVLGLSEEKEHVDIQEDVVDADVCKEPESKKLKL